MIVSFDQFKEKYNNISDIKGKIKREITNKNLIPITKGLYETNSEVHGSKLSQFIYGPSYLSFDYALYYYGLIPENVYNTFTCASYNKRKIKKFNNYFGTYIYRDIPSNVFYHSIITKIDANYCYHIATPEKALCDKLYSLSPVRSLKDIKNLLFKDLRIDADGFKNLNFREITEIAPLYRSTNLNLLVKLLRKEYTNE